MSPGARTGGNMLIFFNPSYVLIFAFFATLDPCGGERPQSNKNSGGNNSAPFARLTPRNLHVPRLRVKFESSNRRKHARPDS
jgi:hypothetical protein